MTGSPIAMWIYKAAGDEEEASGCDGCSSSPGRGHSIILNDYFTLRSQKPKHHQLLQVCFPNESVPQTPNNVKNEKRKRKLNDGMYHLN